MVAMNTTIQSILYMIAAGVLLFFGVFILRFVLRFAWKFIRAALILLSLLFIAGYFFGIFDIVLP